MAVFLKSQMHYGALRIAVLYCTHRKNKQNGAGIYISRSHPRSFNAEMMSIRYTLDIHIYIYIYMKCHPSLCYTLPTV
jgi:hypothetical protein